MAQEGLPSLLEDLIGGPNASEFATTFPFAYPFSSASASASHYVEIVNEESIHLCRVCDVNAIENGGTFDMCQQCGAEYLRQEEENRQKELLLDMEITQDESGGGICENCDTLLVDTFSPTRRLHRLPPCVDQWACPRVVTIDDREIWCCRPFPGPRLTRQFCCSCLTACCFPICKHVMKWVQELPDNSHHDLKRSFFLQEKNKAFFMKLLNSTNLENESERHDLYLWILLNAHDYFPAIDWLLRSGHRDEFIAVISIMYPTTFMKLLERISWPHA